MMKLTDTQTQILLAAASQHDRLVKPPAIPPAPRGAIEAKLRGAGLIEQVQLDADESPAMAWRYADTGAIGYRITDPGLAMIGVDAREPQSAAAEAERGGLSEADYEAEQELAQRALEAGIDLTAPDALVQAAAAGLVLPEQPVDGRQEPADAVQPPDEPNAAQARQEGPHGPPQGTAARPASVNLRGAVHTFLAAWDASQDRASLEDAIAALRAALPAGPVRQARDPAAPRAPRQGTKQQQVLGLLRRQEGATIAQIVDATAWQPHTVRVFLAGLKKRQGVAVEVLERVRQVGPNKQGAKGSFSIYRIAHAG